MPIDAFVRNARTAPNPHTTPHDDPQMNTSYTCHMAVIHWAFMDLGDSQAQANARLTAIIQDTCPLCGGRDGNAHGSLLPNWYGTNFCVGAGASRIANRAALYASVNPGDVLILPDPRAPMHTMVVVQKSQTRGRSSVLIRGFNNVGTLGTGSFLAYDGSDRNIDDPRFWRAGPGGEVFGHNAGSALHVIPYPNFRSKATEVRMRY